MKKILSLLLVLTVGVLLTGCGESGTPEDIAAVSDAYGKIILSADTANIQRDFYLTRTEIDGVAVTWTSKNEAIEITTTKAQLTYDDKEYDYYVASVTQQSSAVTGTLSATLTKGDAKKVWEENTRVLSDQFTNITTYTDYISLTNNDKVRIKVEVVAVDESDIASYNNFAATIKFVGEDTEFDAYRVGTDFLDLFVVGDTIIIEGVKTTSTSGATIRVGSIEYVKKA